MKTSFNNYEPSFGMALHIPNKKQVEKKLSDDFVRCHGGYIVNLAYIVGIENLEICLRGGSRLPIGTRFYDEFKSRYLEYHVGEI